MNELQYFIVSINKKDAAKPYTYCGDEVHDSIDEAMQEASLFDKDNEYELLGLVQVNTSTGKTETIYDAATLEDEIRKWDFDQLSEEEQKQQRKDEADIARWEDKHDAGEA